MNNMILIGKGHSSDVYQDQDGNVIKIPKIDSNEYVKTQQHGFDIATMVADKLKQHGIKINLPESMSIDKTTGIIKEKLIPGAEFNVDVYKKLDEETKDKLAKDLAKFMIIMHSLEKPEIYGKNLKECMSKSKDSFRTVHDIENGFNKKLPDYIVKKLHDAEQAVYGTNDIADNLFVMTHKDLRGPNVLYDKNTKQFGIIDFELAGKQHIYTDFISSPTSFHWDFMNLVIKYYNLITNLKINGKKLVINPEKIKNLLICRTAQTFAKDIADKKCSVEEGLEKLDSKLQELGLYTKTELMNRANYNLKKKNIINSPIYAKSWELE